MSVFLLRVLLTLLSAFASAWFGYTHGYERGRRRERMSRLDLTSLHLTPRERSDPFAMSDVHMTKFRASTLSPSVTSSANLEEALKKHIRERKP